MAVVVPAPRESQTGTNVLNFLLSLSSLAERKKFREMQEEQLDIYGPIAKAEEARKSMLFDYERDIAKARARGDKQTVKMGQMRLKALKGMSEDELERTLFASEILASARAQSEANQSQIFNLQSALDLTRLQQMQRELVQGDRRKAVTGIMDETNVTKGVSALGALDVGDTKLFSQLLSEMQADYGTRKVSERLDDIEAKRVGEYTDPGDWSIPKRESYDPWSLAEVQAEYDRSGTYPDARPIAVPVPGMLKFGTKPMQFTEEGAKRAGKHEEWLRAKSYTPKPTGKLPKLAPKSFGEIGLGPGMPTSIKAEAHKAVKKTEPTKAKKALSLDDIVKPYNIDASIIKNLYPNLAGVIVGQKNEELIDFILKEIQKGSNENDIFDAIREWYK